MHNYQITLWQQPVRRTEKGANLNYRFGAKVENGAYKGNFSENDLSNLILEIVKKAKIIKGTRLTLDNIKSPENLTRRLKPEQESEAISFFNIYQRLKERGQLEELENARQYT